MESLLLSCELSLAQGLVLKEVPHIRTYPLVQGYFIMTYKPILAMNKETTNTYLN